LSSEQKQHKHSPNSASSTNNIIILSIFFQQTTQKLKTIQQYSDSMGGNHTSDEIKMTRELNISGHISSQQQCPITSNQMSTWRI
jgi:hypothetical protein